VLHNPPLITESAPEAELQNPPLTTELQPVAVLHHPPAIVDALALER
jgi:hypothetical protein